MQETPICRALWPFCLEDVEGDELLNGRFRELVRAVLPWALKHVQTGKRILVHCRYSRVLNEARSRNTPPIGERETEDVQSDESESDGGSRTQIMPEKRRRRRRPRDVGAPRARRQNRR